MDDSTSVISSSTKTLLWEDDLSSSCSSGRKSCEFTSHAAACIQKATINLTRLEAQIEEWQQELISHDELLKAKLESRLLKFNQKDINIPRHKLEAIVSGTSLEIFGKEIDKPTDNVKYSDDEKHFGKQIELTPNKHELVIKNVTRLLERLEADRANMVELLEKERNRTTNLREKIDWHAYKRIHDLPAAVQQEHEKCAYDVQELKWHCAYQGRTEARSKERVRQAENTNKRILKEIKFVKENSPLIEDKLALEREAMVIIKQKQDHTDGELKTAAEKRRSVQQEFEQIKRQAEHEQKMLAERILSLSNELNMTLESFLTAQIEYEKMAEKMTIIQKKISSDGEETISLDKKLAKIDTLEKFMGEQLTDFTEMICNETSENKRLKQENEEHAQRELEQENSLRVMRTTLEDSIKAKTKELQKFLKNNKSTQNEIQTLRRRIESCEKQKIADAKTVKRALAERENVLADLQVIREDTDQTRLVHDQLLLKLDQERVKAAEIEETLTAQFDSLKKQNREESRSRMILQARINADTADFNRRKDESEKKRKKLLKMEQDVKSVVGTISSQVNKLTEKYEERTKAIEGITKLLHQVATKHEALGKTLTSEIKDLEPKEEILMDSLIGICQKQEEMYETKKNFEKKLRGMVSASIMMNKLLLSNQKAVGDLVEELEELQIQLDSGEGLETKLRDSLKEVQDRSTEQRKKHEMQMTARNQAFKDIKERLELSLQENCELAVKYLALQSKHINEKNGFINTYEKALIAQDNLQDKQSLCKLHSRLHEALKCYYQLRGIQTKAGLSRFEEMSKKSNKKLESIQMELETSTRNISDFLAANNNSHRLLQLQHAVRKHPMEIVT